jgi:uncharacterized protein YbjT (DUF2867 family)
VPPATANPRTILVTGGTGTLGRALVPRLAAPATTVRVLSRRPPPAAAAPGTWATGNLRRGEGIGEAVSGAEVIVHCATGIGDVTAAQHLIAAARRAGARHLVYISIVGIDQHPFAYYRAKLRCERLIADSGLPWTVLRTTQFHDLLVRMFGPLARGPALPVPAGTSFQPVDVTEVAGRLAGLAVGEPAGRVPDLGGPQVRTAASLARAYLAASGRRRPVLPVWLPGRAAAAFRQGRHLAPGHAAGRVTFEQFLAARFGAR